MIDPGQPTVDVEVICRWGESDIDPASDLRRWIDQMNTNCGYSPNRLIMPEQHWRRIETLIARRTMSRRAFRRWRGRRRAYWRALRAEPPLPEGVFERDGTLMFTCRACDQDVPLEVDLSEFDPDVAYCGGSPRCLP